AWAVGPPPGGAATARSWQATLSFRSSPSASGPSRGASPTSHRLYSSTSASRCLRRWRRARVWADERARMVERQLRRRGIDDERVLAAMERVPRELFAPPDV